MCIRDRSRIILFIEPEIITLLISTDIKTQLRALYRASAYGNISIMYPMIISEQEVDKIKVIENEVKAELTAVSYTHLIL